jgi:hypothetical protein
MEQLLSNAVALYFLLLAGFAAIAAVTAIQDGERAKVGEVVFWSLTKTSIFLGVPALIGFLVFLNSQSTGDGGGGIMSRNMGLFVLFFLGSLGLLVLWVGGIIVGFVGAALARNLPPLAAGAVVFGAVCFAPVAAAGMVALSMADSKREQERRAQQQRR